MVCFGKDWCIANLGAWGVRRQVECEVFRGVRFEVEREAECRVV